MPQKTRVPPPSRRSRATNRFGTGYSVDPRDERQQQAGYPHPPASDAGADAEDDMLMRRNLTFDRQPDLNQPVPRAGMAQFDQDQEMRNSFAKHMALNPAPKLSALKNLRVAMRKRRK